MTILELLNGLAVQLDMQVVIKIKKFGLFHLFDGLALQLAGAYHPAMTTILVQF